MRGLFMHHKQVSLSIKSVDDDAGTFTGLASVFDNLDLHGDIVRRGAFSKSIAAAQPIPLLWMHKSDDPRNWVGDVISAVETAEGLQIVGKFDLSSEHGQASYRNVKGRRIAGLSIGYAIRSAVKTAEGNELRDLELVEISIVARGANPAALVTAVKSAGADVTEHLRTAVTRARITARTKDNTMHDNTSDVTERHLKGRDEQLVLAKAIVETATELERDLTGDEADQVQKHLDEAQRIEQTVAAHRKSASLLAQLDSMAASTTTFKDGEPVSTSTAAPDSRRLTFKGVSGALATKMLGNDGYSTKALAPSGSAIVAQEFEPSPVELGRPANTLLSVMPVKQHTSPEFSYLRQSVRENLAAVVPEGQLKPTSNYELVQVQDSLDVYAHLSSPAPKFWFTDSVALQQFLGAELQFGLQNAIEAGALATINAAPGLMLQTYATSPLVVLRKSLTTITVQGYEPAFLLVNPATWEEIELALTTSNSIEHQGLPYDASARKLFGVSVVVSNAQAVGVSHAVGQGALALDVDGRGVQLDWSENAGPETFARNEIVARCEMRAATSIYRPGAIVKGDLTA